MTAKMKIEPVALQTYKRGRVCTVAKITYFIGDDRPVLAMVWRNQHGASEAISLPPSALEFARAVGATSFYLRNDRTGRMFTISLEDFEKQGWVGADGECYIRLTSLRPTPWRQWKYAERTVLLDSTQTNVETECEQEAEIEQLKLEV